MVIFVRIIRLLSSSTTRCPRVNAVSRSRQVALFNGVRALLLGIPGANPGPIPKGPVRGHRMGAIGIHNVIRRTFRPTNPRRCFSQASSRVDNVNQYESRPTTLEQSFGPMLQTSSITAILNSRHRTTQVIGHSIPSFGANQLMGQRSQVTTIDQVKTFVHVSTSREERLPEQMTTRASGQVTSPFNLRHFFLVIFMLFNLVMKQANSKVRRGVFARQAHPIMTHGPKFPTPSLRAFQVRQARHSTIHAEVIAGSRTFRSRQYITVSHRDLRGSLFTSDSTRQGSYTIGSRLNFFSDPFSPCASRLLRRGDTTFVTIIIIQGTRVTTNHLFKVRIRHPHSRSSYSLAN